MSETHHPGSPHALRQRHGERYRWLLLLSVMIGAIAALLSSTVVNVAIPDMSHHFQLTQDRAQWVSSGFMAANTVSMLTTPWLLSRFGYRHTYVACNLLLLGGGLLGGFANQYPLVLAARVLEGLAAGAVQPIPAIIIMRAFEPGEQGRASGFFGMGVVLAPAIGPSIGGLLVDAFGWRSIFFLVVPFCLLAIWMAYRFVPVTAPGGVQANQEQPLDWWGLALASTGTVCLLNGLTRLQGGPWAEAGVLMAAAVAVFIAFVVWQRWQKRHHRKGREPLMNLALFQHRPFAMGSLVALIYGIGLFGSTYLLPVYLQAGMGLSATSVGALMLPAGLALGVVIAYVGRLADKRPPHHLISFGLLLLAASFASMALMNEQSGWWWLVALIVLGRIGLGFVLPSLNLGSMRGLQHTLIPQGSSTINFIRMLGGAAGVSLCGVALQWRLAAHGAHLGTPGAEQVAARMAAFHEAFLLLAAVCTLAIVAAWNLRTHRAKLHH